MTSSEKAQAFAALHQKGSPLVLFNVWDAGSAQAVAKGGAAAIASGSWGVAAARGAGDGQDLSMADALDNARQIAAAVDLPVSIDFEGAYAEEPAQVAHNVSLLLDTGAIGLNFEDRVVGSKGLHDMAQQAAKIAATRAVAQAKGVALFINARTDVFFQGSDAAPETLLEEAITRAKAYGDAGANGVFVPGLSDLGLIAQLTEAQPLPVNIMRMGDGPSIADLAQAGVARVSHGPGPYIQAMAALTQAAQAAV